MVNSHLFLQTMIKSMTGFGLGKGETPWDPIVCEIKSVNGRFLDTKIRLPRVLSSAEQNIRKYVSKNVDRGSVSININFTETTSKESFKKTLNEKAVEHYVKKLKKIKTKYKLSGDISINTISLFPDLIVVDSDVVSHVDVWNYVKLPLKVALDKMDTMKISEGKRLKSDIDSHIRTCSSLLAKIKKRMPLRISKYKTRLKKRIAEISDGVGDIDKVRLLTEIAIMADKIDINEEYERFASHIKQFNLSVNGKVPAGKRLNFVLQEMNREASTIGAKANDIVITNYSISLKEQIEMIREQIQNIE